MSRSKARSGRRRSAGEWRALVEDWQASGRSVEEFCRRRKLSASTFRWWRWRLGARGGEQSDGGSAALDPHPEPSWIAVDLEAAASRFGAGASAGAFELRWPDGLTLRVPADFDRDSLARLLSTLEASSC
jgi:hypothetical protein